MSTPSPPAVSPSPKHRLAALRTELDRVDDALHDGLMRRAELVDQVAGLRAKGPTPMRPGREAAIIRRLLARNRAPLNPALVVRVWREMISGFTIQQQPVHVALGDEALRRLGAAHFGPLTTLEPAVSEAEAVEALAAGRVHAALLRWPGDWWLALLERRTGVHIVARLPFWGEDGADAFLLTQAEPDPSGEDLTLAAAPLSGPALQAALRQAGLPPATLLADAHGRGALAALDGFVAADDHRLAAIAGVRLLGAYAVPLGGTP